MRTPTHTPALISASVTNPIIAARRIHATLHATKGKRIRPNRSFPRTPTPTRRGPGGETGTSSCDARWSATPGGDGLPAGAAGRERGRQARVVADDLGVVRRV